jgi:hypothetical protein
MSTTHWQLSNDVNVLPGCGIMKQQRLYQVGVRTLHDVLNYTGPAPAGVNVLQMKYLVRKGTGLNIDNISSTSVISQPSPTLMHVEAPHTTQHSWNKLSGHILHKNGSTTRVEISTLIVTPYGVVMATTWFAKGKWSFRAVTPLMLAVTHVLWTNHEVVSDESDEDMDQKMVVPDYLLYSTDLPWFTVTTSSMNLDQVQKDQLKLMRREVNLYQQHSWLRMT